MPCAPTRRGGAECPPRSGAPYGRAVPSCARAPCPRGYSARTGCVRPRVERLLPLPADVDVVVVVGQRERRSAETEQGDDLLRHDLVREEQDVVDCLLGEPARLLVTEDR